MSEEVEYFFTHFEIHIHESFTARVTDEVVEVKVRD